MYRSFQSSQRVYFVAIAAWSLICLSGCGDKKSSLPSLAGVTDQNATLIAFDSEGEMIDFVHVTPDAHIDRVEFLAPDSGEEITVLGLGPSVHADFPIGRSISSKKAEGFAGKVTAEIEKGVIQQLMGNSINFGSPLKLEHLEAIKKQMGQASREYHERTRIIQIDPAILELTTDAEGNQRPEDLSPAEKQFLDTVIKAVKAKDLESLRQFAHRDPDDTSSYDSVGNFLKAALEKDLNRFRFMRFSADHPNNQQKLELHDGRKIRHSLEPEWVLTLYHTSEDAYMRYSTDLIIGNDNGRLKFPASYADPSGN